MNKTLAPFLNKHAIVYLDDILVYSRDEKEHWQHLRQVITHLRNHGFYCKRSKCDFMKTEIAYLGFVVSKDGVKTDPTKVRAINEWPATTCKKEVQSFLGIINFYRKFLPNLAHDAEPRTELTRKKVSFEWTNQRQEAFEKLKITVTSAPILRYPNLQQPFRVEADASKHALGGVLLQQHNNDWMPVAFHSRALLPAERNYATFEKELLALIDCMRVWNHYLHGQKFKVYSDHQTLQQFFSQSKVK